MKLAHGKTLALSMAIILGGAPLAWSQQSLPASTPSSAKPAPAPEADPNSLTVDVVGHLFSEDQSNLKDYWQALEQRTKETWTGLMPPLALPPQSTPGTVRIVCVVHTDGRISAMTIEERSGKAALDRAALAAIRQSAPYDAFPSGISTDQVKVRFTFSYNGGAVDVPVVDGVKKPGR